MTRPVTFMPTPELGRILDQAAELYGKVDLAHPEDYDHLLVLNAAVQTALNSEPEKAHE